MARARPSPETSLSDLQGVYAQTRRRKGHSDQTSGSSQRQRAADPVPCKLSIPRQMRGRLDVTYMESTRLPWQLRASYSSSGLPNILESQRKQESAFIFFLVHTPSICFPPV